uniref:DUF3381 domain-containing protein n=1 Tax=Timema monikensis TaxID=170555 RepID=A0A7R9EC76_9NEOP|nr:unnamed protein product [Timema monikensis]
MNKYLNQSASIVFDDKETENHPLTTAEIKECVKDIKVLGRKDLRLLLNWWKAMRELAEKKAKEGEEETVKEEEVKAVQVDEDEEELEAVAKQITELQEEEARDLKRKKKRTNKERKKLQDRLNLKMVLRGDEGPRLEGEDMFALNQVTTIEALNTVIDQVPDTVAESDPDSDDELEPKRKMVPFKRDRTDHLDSSGT